MYDFVKLRISDKSQIQTVLHLPFLEFRQTFSPSSGAVQEYPRKAQWKGGKIDVYAPDKLEISGSLHQSFTGSTNETVHKRL